MWSLLFIIVAGGVLSLLYIRAVRERRCVRDVEQRRQYLRIVMRVLASERALSTTFPLIELRHSRLLLSEVIASLVSMTYGVDSVRLRHIVERYDLDTLVLRRAVWSVGYSRARYLSLLESLPIRHFVVERVRRFASDRNRYVRFYAVMVQIAADASTSLHLLSDYRDRLSMYELSAVMQLLCLGALPIAYAPLLTSSNVNLQLLGINIVCRFGATDAEAQLLRMVASPTCDVRREALDALCGLGSSLRSAAVVAYVASLDDVARRRLLRRMAHQGYSVTTAEALFGVKSRPYFERIVNSHKRNIVCSC